MKTTVKSSNLITAPNGVRIVRRYNKNGNHAPSRYSMEKKYSGKWSPITNFDTAAEAVEYAQNEIGGAL